METKHTQQVDFSNPNADEISSASTTSFKQETLEEAAKNYTKDGTKHFMEKTNVELGFKEGAKWQAERMYSEEEVLELAKYITHNYRINAWENVKYGDCSERNVPTDEIVKEWFEQFKKK